jgi:hypothetical protein
VTARGRVLGAATLCALLAACGGGDGDEVGLPEFTPPPTATNSPGGLPTPTPTESFAQDNPVDAYRGFMQAVQIAVGTADADYPGLRQYGEGGVLKYWQGRVRGWSRDGQVILGPLVLDPSVEARGGDKAVLTDCVDDRGWHAYDRATGQQLANKTPEPPLFIRAEVFRKAGVWKVRGTYDFGRGKGPCART